MVSFGALNSVGMVNSGRAGGFDLKENIVASSGNHLTNEQSIKTYSNDESKGRPSENSQLNNSLNQTQIPERLLMSDDSKTSSSRALLERI